MDFSPRVMRKVIRKHFHILISSASINEDALELPGIIIKALVDVSAYSSLTLGDGREALPVCEDIIRGFFELQQLPPEQVAAGVHLWTGVPPPFQRRA